MSKKDMQPKNPSINQLLEKLGMSNMDDPEEERDTDEEDTVAPDILTAAEKAEEEAEEELGIVEQTITEPLKPPSSSLRDTLFAREEKRVVLPPQDPTLEGLEPSLPEEEQVTFVSPPPKIRAVKPVASAAVRKLGAEIARKLPGAERIKIKKRQQNGQLALIGIYTASDLASYTDIESFIYQVIRPTYGDGTYKISGVDPNGNILEAGEINILGQAEGSTASPANATVQLMQQIINQQHRDRKELEAKVNQMPDPVTMLKGLQEVQQNMAPKEDGTIAAVIASQGQQMQAMMQVMQQQSNQTMQMLLAVMQQPKEDPTLKMLLAKLVEDGHSSSSSAPPPPPPPPPPPFEGIKELLVALAPFIVPLMQKRDDSELKEFMRMSVQKSAEQTLTPRDMIQLLNDMQQRKSDNSFKESMENMTMLLTVAQNLRGGESASSSSAGFFDALGALFSNRDFGSSIAQSIRANAEQKMRQQELEARKEQLAMLARMKQSQAATQNAQPPQQMGQVVPMRPPQMPQQPAQMPAVARQAPQPVMQQAVAPVQIARPMQPVTQVQQKTPAPRAESSTPEAPSSKKDAPGFRVPNFPSLTHEHAAAIAMAPDVGAAIGKTVAFLIYLAEFPEWRPLAELLLGMVQQGKKAEAVEMIRTIFSALMHAGMMSEENMQRVVTGFGENFNIIQRGIANMGIETTTTTLQEALEQTAAAEEAEGLTGGDDDDDEDFEDDSDEGDDEEESDDEDEDEDDESDDEEEEDED